LDRPITIFGLEIEDLIGLVLAAGLLLFVAGPFLSLGLTGFLYVLAHRFKTGRPPGYLYERLYRRGFFGLRFLAVPHLVKLQRHYSAVATDEEAGHPIERIFWERR
jgi:hypothetical protein